ncbi:phasin family protein [Inquilinus limosus]|uniref:phasin family protein n=1 Tax=Inquilinus limosus TaxID=171674 RepID=UPI003F1390A3
MRKPESKDELAAGFAAVFPALVRLGGAGTNDIARIGETCAQASLEWQEELVGFVSTRLQANVELQKSIAGCRHVADLVKIQQDWSTAAVRAYLEEAGKLTEIAGRAARNGLASWHEAARSSLTEAGTKPSPANIAAE